MAAIREIEWEPCLLERTPNPELEQRFRRETGRPGDMMQFFEANDWLADTIVRLSVQINTHVHVNADIADQVGLAVSQDNSCRFCFGQQRAFLRVLGFREERITRLEQDHLTGDFTPQEAAALQFARRVSGSQPLVNASELNPLREAGFSDIQIRELAATIAIHLFFNRLATLGALPPEAAEQFPDQWWVRLLRPLLAVRVQRLRFTGHAMSLRPEQHEGLLAAIVNALDGLPIALQLREIIDGMMSAGPLTPRCASLIFAIIARALGSQACEDEAIGLLRSTGLDEQTIAHTLDHLTAPGLTVIENTVVPFARETVWYQAAQLQRRSVEVQQATGKAAFLQIVGITALINALCRISFLRDMTT